MWDENGIYLQCSFIDCSRAYHGVMPSCTHHLRVAVLHLDFWRLRCRLASLNLHKSRLVTVRKRRRRNNEDAPTLHLSHHVTREGIKLTYPSNPRQIQVLVPNASSSNRGVSSLRSPYLVKVPYGRLLNNDEHWLRDDVWLRARKPATVLILVHPQ